MRLQSRQTKKFAAGRFHDYAPALLFTLQQFGLVPASLNHLVGGGEQRFRDGDAESLGGLEVDDKLGFCCLLDRQVRRFLAPEDATGVDPSYAIPIGAVGSVAHQSAAFIEKAI
jgi:hypothetical protein